MSATLNPAYPSVIPIVNAGLNVANAWIRLDLSHISPSIVRDNTPQPAKSPTLDQPFDARTLTVRPHRYGAPYALAQAESDPSDRPENKQNEDNWPSPQSVRERCVERSGHCFCYHQGRFLA